MPRAPTDERSMPDRHSVSEPELSPASPHAEPTASPEMVAPRETVAPPDAALHRFGLPSLRARLVAIIFMALLPAFVLLLAVSGLERNRAYESAAAEALAIARLMRNQYHDILIATGRHLTFISQYPEIATGDAESCRLRLERVLETLGDFRGLSVSDPDGNSLCVVASVPFTGTINSAGRPFFERAKEKKSFVLGGLQTGTASGRPNLTFGYPIIDANGAVTRILGAGRDIDALNQRLLGADFPEQTSLVLVDSGGTVLLRNTDPQEYIGRRFPLETLIEGEQREGHNMAHGLDGIERLYAYTSVVEEGEALLYVLVGFPPERIYGGVDRTLRASLIGLSIISLVALAAAWLSAESLIVRRIDKLVGVADQMRAGNLQVRTGFSGESSEFGQLAATLDLLAEELDQRIRANATLMEELKGLNASLEQRVEVRTQQLQTSNARLLASQAELRRLSAEMTRATENERARIARDIHDQLGQMLTAVKMELRTARRKVQGGGEGVEAKLDDAGALIDETIAIVRRISSDLRPGILDDFGLAAAADWQLQEFEKRTGISYDVEAEIDEERVPPTTATAAFRILQESLTNVMRHAQATHVSVRLTSDEESLTLLVQDNGRGITVEEQTTTRSLGLLGMRERAAQLSGSVELAGAPGKGTTVIMVLPLRPNAANGENGASTKGEEANAQSAHRG